MVYPANSCGFRVNKQFHTKVPLDDKDHSPIKNCNAAVELIRSHRARVSVIQDFVSLSQIRTTMLAKVRPAVNAESHAEFAITSWVGH